MCSPASSLLSVTIFGPESQVHIAAAMLLDHVPFEADLHVPFAPDLPRVTGSPDFVQLVERLKRDLQIAIISPTRYNQGEDSLFKFRCQRSNIDFLGSARDALEEYLVQRKVVVYPTNRGGGRNDSFADAFPHFNSALLPSKYNLGEWINLDRRLVVQPPLNHPLLLNRRLGGASVERRVSPPASPASDPLSQRRQGPVRLPARLLRRLALDDQHLHHRTVDDRPIRLVRHPLAPQPWSPERPDAQRNLQRRFVR